MQDFEPPNSKRLTKAYKGARSFMAKTPVTFLVWHLLIITFGFVFVVAGLVMLVVPGPGALFIVLGIFVLSTEYTWAKRVMGPIRSIIDTVTNWWQDPTLKKIRRQVVGTFLVLIFALISWYLYRFGFTLDGFRALEELLTR
jgi:uncharacterized protein (TIGR02611 family)